MKATENFGLVECPQCKKRAFFPIYNKHMKLKLCTTCPMFYKAVSRTDLKAKSLGSVFDKSKSKQNIHLRLKELA